MSIIDYSWDYGIEDFTLDLDFYNEKDQEDKMWQARTGLNYETLCGAIETIIFMSDKPITLQKIKSHIDSDLPLRVVHESISKLQAEYEQKHHGIRLQEVAQGYQFRTKATYSKIVQSMFKVTAIQLSPTALEVLAIIAYKQPISKTDIENIRGVDSSHIVRSLMDKRLVKICGRSEEIGRPSLFGTTDEFLEIFNLSDVDQLPSEYELEELATASNLASISEIKEVVQKGDKTRFDFDELAELDTLSESINSISSDTLFTRELMSEEKRRNDEAGHVKKSAFDILEEYLSRGEVIEQNKASLESELLTSILEAKVVNVTDNDILHNAPQEDLDEDEVLLTEAASEEILDEEILDEEILDEEQLDEEDEFVPMNPNDFDPIQMADALDEAFDNLFKDADESDSTEEVEKEDAQNADLLDQGMQALDEKTSKISEMAKDLDIDLDFLEKNTQD